jgi:acetyltransferase-like isoleucine patch superfamily enzyme
MKKRIKAILKKNRLLRTIAKNILQLQDRIRKPISGKNNVVINNGVLFKVRYDVVGDNNLIEIGRNSVLSNMTIFIRGNNHILRIAENCLYKGGSVWFEDNNCQVVIGQNTTIESAHLAVTEPNSKIVIGEDCLFSGEIVLRTGDSHSIIDNETKKRINLAQNIEVSNHVWIGSRSTILKGVNIGHNSIIGTNSIVTRNIPSHSVAVGNPARVIKNNIDWVRERIYEQ